MMVECWIGLGCNGRVSDSRAGQPNMWSTERETSSGQYSQNVG